MCLRRGLDRGQGYCLVDISVDTRTIYLSIFRSIYRWQSTLGRYYYCLVDISVDTRTIYLSIFWSIYRWQSTLGRYYYLVLWFCKNPSVQNISWHPLHFPCLSNGVFAYLVFLPQGRRTEEPLEPDVWSLAFVDFSLVTSRYCTGPPPRWSSSSTVL